MRRFCVFKRGKYYYGQIWNPELQKYTTARSTRKQRRRDAEAVVHLWFRDGIPTKHEARPVRTELDVHTLLDLARHTELTHHDAARIVSILDERLLLPRTETTELGEPLIAFLTRFWDYDTSAYVKEKIAYGHSIGRRHCYDMGKHITNHWNEYFSQHKPLLEIVRDDLREFSAHLAEKGLAWKTRNNVMLAGTVAFNWAFENQIIPGNPAQGLKKYSGKTKERGILTDEEAIALFSRQWDDPRAKLGNMLSATTGLRVGEIAALQLQDIGEDVLHIRHSWSEHDRLKAPKSNRTRTVPLLPGLRTELINLANRNPHGCAAEAFVFWSTVRNDTPCDRRLFTDQLRMHLQAMKIDTARGVVFHSWRHYYTSKMADHLDKRKVMLATGHRDGSVFDIYANHENIETLREVGDVMKSVFAWVS